MLTPMTRRSFLSLVGRTLAAVGLAPLAKFATQPTPMVFTPKYYSVEIPFSAEDITSNGAPITFSYDVPISCPILWMKRDPVSGEWRDVKVDDGR